MVENPYPTRWIVDAVVGRPWGWAAHNLRELRVNCVWTAIRDYYRDPNSMTRDMMLTHAFDCDLRICLLTILELHQVGVSFSVSGNGRVVRNDPDRLSGSGN